MLRRTQISLLTTTGLLLFVGLASVRAGVSNQSTEEAPLESAERPVQYQDQLRLSTPMKDTTKEVGLRHIFFCDITGFPVPTYRWYKDGILITSKRGRVVHRDELYGSTLRFEFLQQLDKGSYTCVAENKAKTLNTTAYLNVVARDPKSRSSKNPEKKKKKLTGGSIDDERDLIRPFGFCERFRSTVCKKYIGESLVYVKHERFQGMKEVQISKLIETITRQSHERCGQLLVKAACLYNFPTCSDLGSRQVPRRLCREECEILTASMCHIDYRDLVAKGNVPASVLLNCSSLPSMEEGPMSSCLLMGLQSKAIIKEPQIPTLEDDCYEGRGEDYRGSRPMTFSGKSCVMWKSVSEFDLDGAFCRNPTPKEMQRPWCFVEFNNQIDKEYCAVEKCPMPEEPDQWTTVDAKPIIVSVSILAALSLVALLVCCFWRRVGNAGYTGFKKVEKPQEMLPPPPQLMPMAVQEHAHEKIRFGELLGQGLFGPVYRGHLRNGESGPSPVIIKTLQPSMIDSHMADFRREATILSELAHPNVTILLGISLSGSPPCILIETLPQGDLHEYLLYHNPNGCCSDSAAALYTGGSDLSFGPPMTQAEQLHAACQVASALEYLAAHHFVHRDVATRNVVVGEGLQCKLADFASARDVYAADYYRAAGAGCASLLPIRWMSPEAIMYGKFAPESDMWSFGILLWEIWSFGLQPYFGYNNTEVLKLARSHQILQCPSDCPSRVYALMVECWNELPQHRPQCKEVAKRLRAWHAEAAANEAGKRSHSHSSGHTSSTVFSGTMDGRPSATNAAAAVSAQSRLLPPIGLPLRPPVAPPPTTRELNSGSPAPSSLSGDSMEGQDGGTYIPSQTHIV